MKAFEDLTYLGQVRRLRRLALAALQEYGLAGVKLKLIGHEENTTYRVDSLAPTAVEAEDGQYVENRYLLRIHRPGHQTAESIGSELAWLTALRRDTAMVVPEPVPSLEGEWLVEAHAPGIPGGRNCTLFRWMRGRLLRRHFRDSHFRDLGRLMARLHAHGAGWQRPPGFTRRHWDWEGLFGDDAGLNLSGREVWALLPEAYHEGFAEVAERTRRVMAELATGPEAFGLIHADLHLGDEGNVLYSGGRARPIDFDDCGFGYWIYDFAVPLAHWQLADAWPGMRDALLDGYAEIRPLPEAQMAHLDLFMAGRHVSEILWAVDQAQVNPGIREELDGWMAWAGKHVGRYLEGVSE